MNKPITAEELLGLTSSDPAPTSRPANERAFLRDGSDVFETALAAESVDDPVLSGLARSIFQQESGSGRNTKTSNAGAVGGMQILPGTFKEVADRDWDIADPVHNARAGIRYIKAMASRVDGDPFLTAVGYYGGPGAQQKAKNGVAVSDPRNPNAPNTLQYAQQVVSRNPALSSGKTASTTKEPSPITAEELLSMTGGLGLTERPAPIPERSAGETVANLGSMLWSGVKDLGRSAMATGYTATSKLNDVELLAQAQKADESKKPEEYQALMQEIARRKEENPDAPWWKALGDVGDATWKNKIGTAQMIASQVPNSAAVLGGAWAGGKAGAMAGSVLGPAGAAAGGLIGAFGGMFLGNYLMEAGGKALEKAGDGFTKDEASDTLTEGAKKAAVVTGVDAATLGLGNLAGKTIFGGAARAGAKAEAKVLADAGIDITSRDAVIRALSTRPELVTAAKTAGEQAAKKTTTLGVRAARAAGGLTMETTGEGIGEYMGEVAATGKGDVYDAALESLSSFPQSAAETAWNIRKTNSNYLDPKGIVRASAGVPAPNGPLTRALNAGTPPATPLSPQTPPEAAPTAETPTAASAPAAAPAVPPIVSPAPSDTSAAAIGQDEIDPEMAAMADTDLAALIAGIESSDEAKVSDDDWVRYYLAKEEVKRRKSPPATAQTPAAQPPKPPPPSRNPQHPQAPTCRAPRSMPIVSRSSPRWCSRTVTALARPACSR